MSQYRPEAQFQIHLINYLQSRHGYTLLESEDISDKEFYIAEALLLAFIKATQAETLARLQINYGSDSFDEILKALKAALAYQPLWLIIQWLKGTRRAFPVVLSSAAFQREYRQSTPATKPDSDYAGIGYKRW
jgi:hypothetical protein